MAQIFNYSGDDDFYHGGSLYSNAMEINHFSPCKRARISAPFVQFENRFDLSNQISIDVLPDECLFEILRRLPGGQERSACAGVSKRWLSLLSSIQIDELSKARSESNEDGFLTRSLEGKKATDVRLAAIAVGTSNRGGLGKLIIKGSNPNPSRRVTDLGLKAISRCCPNLKALTLWNVPSISDEGLIEIGHGCNQLEKLDLSHCAQITDAALIAIAKGSPNLTSISIDSCPNVGNEGLKAFGHFCPNLKSISIKDCPIVGDQGVSAILSSTSNVLTKLKLQGLNISDVSLAVIGHYCRSVSDLTLSNLQNLGERGFWCLGNGHGLQNLKTFTITSCRGVTDLGLQSISHGCPNLKTFCLGKSTFVSDNGLVSFAKSAVSLDTLSLDECHRITQVGFFGLLLNCSSRFKTLSVSNCFGIKDMPIGTSLTDSITLQSSLKSISIRNCPLFGDVNLSLLSAFCNQTQFLDLSGLAGISDHGVTPLFETCDSGLVKVNLGGCTNLTDDSISTLTRVHGGTLELLDLHDCRKLTDATLSAISGDCLQLNELDVSSCAITDAGVNALSRSKQLVATLQVLSVSSCTLLSDKCLGAMARLGQSLMGLNLQNCNGISTTVVEMLVERLWNCDILS